MVIRPVWAGSGCTGLVGQIAGPMWAGSSVQADHWPSVDWVQLHWLKCLAKS